MLQSRRERLANTPKQTGSNQEPTAPTLLQHLAIYTTSKHLPLPQILAHLHIPASGIDEEATRYLVATLVARVRQAPCSEIVKATLTELTKTPFGIIFPKLSGKHVLTRANLSSAFATFLPPATDFSVSALVDFLSYNNRSRVRLCDVKAALYPPVIEEDGDEEIEEDTEVEEAKAKVFADMVATMEKAEKMGEDAVTPDEIVNIITFLDPGNDGEVDLKELETAFRISRRDSTKKNVDLEKQKKYITKLKAQLVEASKPIVEKSDFTDEEINRVMAFMDPDRDGITTDEFEAGFRTARRAKASAVAEACGRLTLTKLLDRIKVVHPDFTEPVEWFHLCNANPGPPGSPVEVSGLELRAGLSDLKTFTLSDIDSLLKYMDPDGDCDLSVPEFNNALVRLSKPMESDDAAKEAGEIVVKLERHMDEANIRMIDLFRMMDKDGEGSIEPAEMEAGLRKLALPSGVERAKKKMAREKSVAKITKILKNREKQQKMQDREKEAETSGAGAVLRTLEKQMVTKGQRMIDLFRTLDKSGDGQISHAELMEGLKELAGPTPYQKAMMRRAVEEQEKNLKDMEEKQLNEAKIKEHVLRSVSTGAAGVLNRLHKFITEGEQERKIADVFREYDSGGEGSLSHGELAMAMDLLDMELSDKEVAAFISFVDESDDGDVDLAELDAAMKGFLRIKRVNPNFGEYAAPRMTADEIDSVTESIMSELGDSYDLRALETLLRKAHGNAGDASSKVKSEVLKESRKYAEWLEKSRCSKAPTGRLPSIEDSLTEQQKLEIETEKLRKKKERAVLGEVSFQSWLKKKWGEEKVNLREKLEKEKEDLGVELPPIVLLDDGKIDAVLKLAGVENGMVEGVRIRAAFMYYARELGIEFSAADQPKAVKDEMLNLDKTNSVAHKSILLLWRKNEKEYVVKLLDKLFPKADSKCEEDKVRRMIKDKLAVSTKFYDQKMFEKAKEEFKKEQKQQKKKDGADAWKMWESRKKGEVREEKRRKKKEYSDLMAKQKSELEKLKKQKKEKRDEYMASLGVGKGGLGGTGGSVVSGRSKMSKKTNMTMSSMMSSTTALLLCEASISPYGADPGKAYDKRNLVMKEKLKEIKQTKKKLPQALMDEAERFRTGILGPIPKNYTPIIGRIVGGSGMDYMDVGSLASTIGSADDDMSLQSSVTLKKVVVKGGGGARGGGGTGGRPPRAVKATGRPGKVKEVKVVEEEKKEEEEDEYGNDDFEDAGEVTFDIQVTQTFGEGEEELGGAEEEEVVGEKLDFFNTEAVADLPMEVYGDDFEDDDESGYKVPLIEATPPPVGHFVRPNTSGGGEGRPVSRSSSTEGRSRGRN